MLKIQIIIFDGFDELDAIAPFEVLQSAAAVGSQVKTELVTLNEVKEITAAHGLKVKPQVVLNSDAPPDILIVPGGGWSSRAERGAWAEAQRGKIPAAISRLFNNDNTTIASVCTGAMLIATAELLNERSAITHHSAIPELQAKGAKITKTRVVDDDKIITAAGVTSGLELALWLLERFLSPQVAYEVERELEYERCGTVWRKSASNSRK
ncbi:DJ-1/PfpI family protein [Myxosarcina sp. GI1(2024)]